MAAAGEKQHSGVDNLFSWLVGLNATIDVVSATRGIFRGYFWGFGRG